MLLMLTEGSDNGLLQLVCFFVMGCGVVVFVGNGYDVLVMLWFIGPGIFT